MGGNISGMKPLIFHGDPVSRIASAEVHLLGGITSLSGKFNVPARRVSLAQNCPQVFEPQLASISECPSGLREAGKTCLRIDFVASRLPLQLRHGKRIPPESESCGEIRREGQITQRR